MPLRFTSLNLKGLFQFSGEFASNEISGPPDFFVNLKTAEMCSSRDSLKHFCVIYFAVREGDVTRGEGGGGEKECN